MILDDIIAATKIRVEKAKQAIPLEEMKQAALAMPINQDFPFEKALTGEGIRFICECKKASPSKGVIVEDFPYLEIAKAYEEAGASALSVLTEPDFFQGENRFLTEIKQAVSLPVIRKDFIIDAYQIYEAKVIGADAVLLIATILNEEELDALQRLARELGLSALVEAHTEEELLKALRTNPKMIGVNNRDLKTFKVDIQQSIRLRALVPDDILFVAESGISERQQVIELEEGNVDAILIGETMMISPDKKGMLDRLRGIG